MDIAIRPTIVPRDYAAIAAVLQAESPEWGATAEELAHDDAGRDPRYYWAVLVAEAAAGDTPLMVGVAFIGQDTLAQRDGAFEINLRVRPDWQGRGVGKALYQAALAQLAPLAPRELSAMVWQAHPRSARFLLDRGFVETWQRIDSYLDVAGFDWTPYAGLEERVKAQGIQITTYGELAGRPDRLTRLYELDCALWQDVPYGQAVVQRSPSQFATETVNHPSYLPDACFIALKDGAFVGYSNLLAIEAGYSIDMTGVLQAYRGKGVATLLKLRGIRYAQEHGNRRLWAVNDSVNTAVLALNQKLGFLRAGANIRYVKQLATDIRS